MYGSEVAQDNHNVYNFPHLQKVGTQMELQIQDLVASIKRDGIEEAEKKAAEIISEADRKAEEIIASAKKEAGKLVDEAKKDIDVRDQSARASLQQAARDVQLSLKKALQEQLDRLLEKQIAQAFDSKALVDLIAKVVSSGIADPAKSVIELDEKACKALAMDLKAKLANEIKAGLEIRPVAGVDAGFRIADKDGSGFYDFGAEETASMMAPFLSPAIQEIVFTSAKR